MRRCESNLDVIEYEDPDYGIKLIYTPGDKWGAYYELDIGSSGTVDDANPKRSDWNFITSIRPVITPELVRKYGHTPSFWFNFLFGLECRYPLAVITRGFLDDRIDSSDLEQDLLRSPRYRANEMRAMKSLILAGQFKAQLMPSGISYPLAIDSWIDSYLLYGNIEDIRGLISHIYKTQSLIGISEKDLNTFLYDIAKRTLVNMEESGMKELLHRNRDISEEEILSKGMELYLILSRLRIDRMTDQQIRMLRNDHVLPAQSGDEPIDSILTVPSKVFIDRLENWCVEDIHHNDRYWKHLKHLILKRIKFMYPDEEKPDGDSKLPPGTSRVVTGVIPIDTREALDMAASRHNQEVLDLWNLCQAGEISLGYFKRLTGKDWDSDPSMFI